MRKSACSSRLTAMLVVGAVLCAISGSSASGGSVAGNAVAVRPKATVANPEGTLTLKVGMDVAMGDKIKTDNNGEVQLVFSDKTRLVVGPKSSLIIEAYLLRSNSRANNFTVRALGGSFRMITGKSEKKAYKIKTPTATIGVRGTSFDFTIRRNGETAVMLFNGEAQICGRNGSCRILNRRCSVAQAPRNADVRLLREKENRNAQIKRSFPYAVSQESLRRDFRVKTSGCSDTAKIFDPIDKVRAVPAQRSRPSAVPTPPSPETEPPSPEPGPPAAPGNPGNGGPMGKAGSNPGNNDFGNPGRGRSDTAPGRSKSNNGNGKSNNGRGKP